MDHIHLPRVIRRECAISIEHLLTVEHIYRRVRIFYANDVTRIFLEKDLISTRKNVDRDGSKINNFK